MRRIPLYVLLLSLFGILNSQRVVINEVMYSNKSILFDKDGDTPDWFELYNAGDEQVNLKNFKIIDDTNKTEYWNFPEYIMQPKTFLVVFASGKNSKTTTPLHTNFKLGNMKESLFLIGPDNDIIDEVKPVCAPTDCSVGKCIDGKTDVEILEPTPGKSNNIAKRIDVNFIADSLTVNYESGFYDNPVSVKLANLHPENRIVYTLDGSTPDEESPGYIEPIDLVNITGAENRFANEAETSVNTGNNIIKANILRARVYSNGCPASNEEIKTYFIGENIKKQYGVYVSSLITDEDNLFDEETGIYVFGKHRNYEKHGKKWEREAHLEVFDSSGNMIIDQDAGIRIHGRGSRTRPQKSFRLYAGDDYNTTDFHYPFFSLKPQLTSFKTLTLRGTNGCFGTLFKDELCHYLVRDMNIDNMATETTVLFVNGEFWGIYSLMERQDRHYIENNYGIQNPELTVIGYDMDEILVEEGTIGPYDELINFLQQSDPLSDNFFNEVDNWIDLDAIIDFYVAQMYFANYDFPQNNLELWRLNNDTSKWRHFYFDADFSMAKPDYDHLSEYNNLYPDFQRFPEYSTYILRTLLKNETFRNKFYAAFERHLRTTFNPARVIEAINYFEKKYAPIVSEHIYRWHEPIDYPKWENEIHWLRNFAMQRPIIIAEQLKNNFGNPFIVYPNPASDQLNFEYLTDVTKAEVQLVSLNGTIIEHVPMHKNNFQYNIPPNVPAGAYLLKIKLNQSIYYSKIIIQP